MSSTRKQSATLLSLCDAEFEVAKGRNAIAARAALLAGALSIAALLVQGEVNYVIGCAALIGSVVSFGCRQAAGGAYGRALRALRHCQIAWAYHGREPDDAAELSAAFSRRARTTAVACPRDPTRYWSSAAKLPVGGGRLAAIIDESAFWTRTLSRDAANRSLWFSGGYLAFLVSAALIGIPMTSDDDAITAAKIIVLLFGVLLSSGALARGLAWRSALTAFGSEPGASDPADLLLRFGDYHAAIATVPPIPTALYERRQPELEDLWSKQKA